MSDPTILFTRKDDWQRQIANAARHFTPVFHDLHDAAAVGGQCRVCNHHLVP